MSEAAPKRFYKEVTAAPSENGFGVFLDGRQARTMGRSPLAHHAKELVEAVAEEWAAQGEHIDRKTMPLTALLSVAIDGDEAARKEWAEEILSYLNSDLVCYRASKPKALVNRQHEVWDPYLDWFADHYGAPLMTVEGLIAKSQSDHALNAVRQSLEGCAPEILLGLSTATAITGSAVLALALWQNAFPAEAVFEASRLDERFQEERWGVDGEAHEREQHIKSEFEAVVSFLRLL